MTQNLRLNNKSVSYVDSDMLSGQYSINPQITGNIAIGNGYTWYDATVNSLSGLGNAPYSICAKSWHLPIADEYNALYKAYNNNQNGILLQPPANFTLYGYNGDSRNVAELWSATIIRQEFPRFSGFNRNGVTWNNCGDALCGCNGCGDHASVNKPIRCISS